MSAGRIASVGTSYPWRSPACSVSGPVQVFIMRLQFSIISVQVPQVIGADLPHRVHHPIVVAYLVLSLKRMGRGALSPAKAVVAATKLPSIAAAATGVISLRVMSSSLGLRVRCKCWAPSWLGRIRSWRL
jgi:hypothetical protein